MAWWCWHKWKKWEIVASATYTDQVTGKVKDKTIILQRECEKCGWLQRKEIGE